jgi:4-amino-4-deoxy-L-arabinose transferase-like glycosyltransferase
MKRKDLLIEALLLAVIVATGFAFRWRGIGHLLFWDEAMDIAGVRALVTQSHDWYSNVLWVHPPGFLLLMSLLNPLSEGFAERSQLAAVLVQSLNLLILYALNRAVFGRRVALFAGLCLALLPGAVFFDVWIKRDHLVTTFGLLALYAGARNRILLCGFCLGLSLLSKETGVFFVPPAMLILLARSNASITWKAPLAALAVAAATCGWWYALFSTTVQSILGFAAGSELTLTEWSYPWYYYGQRLVSELGFTGCTLAGVGGLSAIGRCWHKRPSMEDLWNRASDPRLWPWMTLFIGYAVLSLSRGKTPWMTVSFYPAWATVAGLGLVALIDLCRRARPSGIQGNILGSVAGAGCCAMLLVTALGQHHEDEQKRLGFGWWWGSDASRQAAEAINRVTTDKDRLLLTSFYYWGDDPVPTPCPIFAYYFRKDVPTLVRSFRLKPEEAANLVREHQLTWALFSPVPGKDGNEFLGSFIKTNGLKATLLPGAVLVDTRPMLDNGRAQPPP